VPVVRLHLDRLKELLSGEIKEQELEDIVFTLKGEIESINKTDGTLDIEFTMDRPDLLISEGVARAIKGLKEIETGFPKLTVKNSDYQLLIHDVPSRPYIAIGIIKNYPLDEKTLEELIQFQEKIHLTVGRKRKKVAIGIHDLDKIPSKKLEYKPVHLDYQMIPLGHSDRWTVRDVLKETVQGRLYGSYSIMNDHHPAILSDGEIISLPPVINSDVTRLDVGTKNLLIDVTGTDEFTVLKTLDLITSILSERKNAFIELCMIVRNNNSFLTPGLTPTFVETTISDINRTLGVELSGDDIVRLGEKMRWEVLWDEDNIRAGAPEYRTDVLHPVDFIEDLAVSYGYSNFTLEPKPVTTKPKEDEYTVFKKHVKRILIGLGYTQFLSFTMISDDLAKIAPESGISPIRIINPISNEMSSIRPSIIPSLIQAIRESQKSGLPLRIFEIGYYGYIDAKSKGLSTGEKLALALVDYRVGYEDIQSALEGLLSILGITPVYQRYYSDIFIKGRSSIVKYNDTVIGYVGEIYPQILVDNQIKHPVGVAEVYLDILYQLWKIH